MEINGDAFYGRVILRILNSIRYICIIESIHYHVHTEMLMTAFRYILLKLGKCAFSTHLLVVTSGSIKTDPDRIGMRARKWQLRISGYRA